MVAIGNIHGQGEILLEHLAELPPDESADEPVAATAPAGRTEPAPAAFDSSETMQLYAPRIDPYQHYPEAYEARYAPQQQQQHQPYGYDSWTEPRPEHGGPPVPALPQAPADSGRAAEPAPSRGLFEPRRPPQPSADDSQQWHSPGEQR
jgi:hypothetical protein